MSTRKAADAPQEPTKPAASESNAERPLEGTGLGLGNPWDLAYANNVPPKRDATQLPPAEETHIGTMADPTPRDEYTVAGQLAKQDAADKQKEG